MEHVHIPCVVPGPENHHATWAAYERPRYEVSRSGTLQGMWTGSISADPQNPKSFGVSFLMLPAGLIFFAAFCSYSSFVVAHVYISS